MNTTTPTLALAATEARALIADLSSAFREREPEIRAVLLATIAGEHVLLLGEPGTAKSAVTQAVATSVDWTGADDVVGRPYFSVLMTRYTTPEEVFGPVSLAGLERDEYRRVTDGYLPSCRVAFLDEVFKANSAILNALLTVVNEREFDNGGQRVRVPLEVCIGASNELPEDDSLAALYDRFVLRRWVVGVRSRDSLRALLTTTAAPSTTARLSHAALVVLRAAVDAVTLPDDVLDTLLEIRDTLAAEHGVTASDRRWRKIARVVRAAAVLAGRTTCRRNDLAVLTDCLWRRPDERAAIAGVVGDKAAPSAALAQGFADAAHEVVVAVGPIDKATVQDRQGTMGLGSAASKLRAIRAEVEDLDATEPGVAEVVEAVDGMLKAILRQTRAALKL